eukprot:9469996-Pyramimonas_sp.AAC.2
MCRNGPRPPCEPCRWGLRWSFVWGHDPCEGCADMTRGRHANPATGAFGGAPNVATKHCNARFREEGEGRKERERRNAGTASAKQWPNTTGLLEQNSARAAIGPLMLNK